MRRVLALLVLCFGWPVGVLGQKALAPPAPSPPAAQAPADSPPLFGQLKIGSLAFVPMLRLTEFGVDTDIFDLASEGTKRLPPDFVAHLQPGLELRLRTRRVDATGSGGAGMIYYQKQASERSVDPIGAGNVTLKVSPKLAILADLSRSHTRARYGPELQIRPRRTTAAVSIGARFVARRIGADVTLGRATTTIDPRARYFGVQLAQTQNQTLSRVSLHLTYKLTPYTTVLVRGEAQRDEFTATPIRNIDSNRFSAGLALNPRALVAGDVEVGYRLGKTRNDLVPDFSGVVARAGVSSTIRGAFSIAFGVERDLQHSYRVSHPYYVLTQYDLSLRQALLDRFDIGVGGSHATMAYRAMLDAPPTALPLEATQRSVSGSFGVLFGPQKRVGFFVERRESAAPELQFGGYRAGLQLTLGRLNINQRGIFVHGASR